jgi:hypothetical protein
VQQFKSIVVQHKDELRVQAMPPPPAAPSATPAKPAPNDQLATGIDINSTTLTITGKGLSQVVAIRYLDTSLPFTITSNSSDLEAHRVFWTTFGGTPVKLGEMQVIKFSDVLDFYGKAESSVRTRWASTVSWTRKSSPIYTRAPVIWSRACARHRIP